MLGIHFRHFATLAVAVTAFVPLVMPVLILAPWIVSDLFLSGEADWLSYLTNYGLRGIILSAVAVVVLPSLESTMNPDVYKNTHPYAMSLAIYAGFSAWGTAGIVFGPICMLLLGVIKGLSDEAVEDVGDNNIKRTVGSAPTSNADAAAAADDEADVDEKEDGNAEAFAEPEPDAFLRVYERISAMLDPLVCFFLSFGVLSKSACSLLCSVCAVCVFPLSIRFKLPACAFTLGGTVFGVV